MNAKILVDHMREVCYKLNSNPDYIFLLENLELDIDLNS